VAIEKRLYAVPSQLLTANGQSNGLISLPDSTLFKVKQVIFIASSAQSPVELEVKRIDNLTSIWIGPKTGPIDTRFDASAFLVADGAFIFANEQPRPGVPEQVIPRAVFEEEPTLAIRTMEVDQIGNPYTVDNPFPVQLSDGSINIGSVNAELEVQLSHLDDVPDVGDVHDSVRIGDGVETLAINPDGSINVVANITGGVITSPTIANVSILLANTEYSYTLPTGTKKIILKVRDGMSKTKLSFISGTSGTNYVTVTPGTSWSVEGISSLAGFTLYFQTSKSDQVMEILTWL